VEQKANGSERIKVSLDVNTPSSYLLDEHLEHCGETSDQKKLLFRLCSRRLFSPPIWVSVCYAQRDAGLQSPCAHRLMTPIKASGSISGM
ncbi:hypothetical protein GOODEAATRI_017791, partial [Goodea atripinnis]